MNNNQQAKSICLRVSTTKKRLTPAAILSQKSPVDRQQIFIRDANVKGLCLRVTAAGKKSLVYDRRVKGGGVYRETLVAEIQEGTLRDIGEAEKMLAKARRQAEINNEYCLKGLNPGEEKSRTSVRDNARQAARRAEEQRAIEEAEARQIYTLAALCEAYAAQLESEGRGKSARQVRSAVKCHVLEPWPEMAATPARDITTSQIVSILRRTNNLGMDRTTGLLRAYLHRAYRLASKVSVSSRISDEFEKFRIEQNPVAAVEAIDPPPPRERCLTASELGRYLAALGDHPPDVALRVALLAGGQRMAQLLRAKVGDFNPEENILRLWDGKGKRKALREHLLPLAPVAAGLVRNQYSQARTQGKSYLFFSNKGEDIPIFPETLGRRVVQISAAMGGEPFIARDLRRTAETMLSKLGVSSEILKHTLSHGFTGSVQERNYNKNTFEGEKRKTLALWEKHLAQLVRAAKKENVTFMEDRRKVSLAAS